MAKALEFNFRVKVKMRDLDHVINPKDTSRYETLSRADAFEELQVYIQNAVASWGGQNYPGHFLHTHNIEEVIVFYNRPGKK